MYFTMFIFSPHPNPPPQAREGAKRGRHPTLSSFILSSIKKGFKKVTIPLCLFLIPSLACGGGLGWGQSEIKRAESKGFKRHYIQTDDFELTSLIRVNAHLLPTSENKNLIIYIEGDGRSWINKHTLSKNPTPSYALGLRLAILDPRKNDPNTLIAYLARPCMFTLQKPSPTTCGSKYWSSHRFSETVIDNMNQAIDKIKAQEPHVHYIELIGYSGGASVALLIAARRNDINYIRTVAGDVNHEMMTAYHHTTPLPESLNPIHYVDKLKNIPQTHYIGTQDKIVPNYITQNFVQLSQNDKSKIVSCKATHQKGWEEVWSLFE